MKVRMLYKVCLVLITLACSAQAANILAIFIVPSYSHQMPLLRLSKALATRGHNLTVITSNPSDKPIANHTEIDLSFGYELLRNGTLGIKLQSKQKMSNMIQSGIYGSIKLIELQLKSPQMQNFLSWVKDVKFDLVLYENIFAGPYLALAHTLGPPPIIGVSTIDGTLWSDETMGTPTNPAYVPVSGPYTDHMTFFERLYNLYDHLLLTYYTSAVYEVQDQLVKDVFGEGFPSVYDMEHNKTLLMLSGDSILSFPKPVTPNIVQLGPLHILPPKPLTDDFKTWVEGAKYCVIYFSLGSNMQGTSLPDEKRNAFLAAFSRLPNYRVIWKWETNAYLPGQAENIMFKKWIPQQDLLAHDKVNIFISQCGLQSAQEAIHYGVNIICIPLFGDQDRNSRKVVSLGIGIELDFDCITADMIYEALKEIIYNQRYRENIDRVSAIAKDRVMSPVDEGVWWVEYVLRHRGAKHLRPVTLDLHWIQYYLLDIAAFLIGIIIVAVFLTIKFIKIALTFLQKYINTKAKRQ